MSDSEEDWEEIEKERDDEKCPCPFCEEVLLSAEGCLTHCCNTHDIDLLKHKQSLCLDFYEWIKLINYIRKEQPSTHDVLSTKGPPFPWSDNLFLQPVIPDDPLLQLDFDDNDDEETRERMEAISLVNNSGRGEDPVMDELIKKLKETQLKLMESEKRLNDAYQDMNNMRHAMTNIISEGTEPIIKRKSGLEEEEEDGYFSTYSHYSIHEEMLKDDVRMESYHLFISRNTDLFKDKVVLDVGCGTGILSMFAVKSGASHVIAIDQSEIIYKAMEIARENSVSDSITFIRGRVEEVVLPVEKVDIIISEWMGYMLLFESMLDTVLFARDKWLKDQRHVYPNNCSISLVAIGDNYEYQNNVGFWDDIKGFKMSCMRSEVMKEAKVLIVDGYSLISSADVIKKFDLSSVQTADLQFESDFSLTMLHTTTCHAIVSYFDIGFEVDTYRVYFSTSPQDTPTHWKQTVFFLNEPLKVQTGDMLRGTFKCSRNTSDHRCMIVQLSMELTTFHKDDTGQNIKPIILRQSFSLC